VVVLRREFGPGLGADGVLHDLQEAGHVVLDPGATILFDEDNQHRVLEKAAALEWEEMGKL